MAVIGALNVLLQASTSGLTQGLAKAKEKATDFAKSWIPSWQSVGVAVGAAAVAASAAFAVLAKQAADNAGRLDDLAKNVGSTVDAIHALEYASHMLGVSSADLEGILSKMSLLLAEAAMNGGPTAKALEQIGLSAEELSKDDITDAFKKIAKGLSGVEHEGKRASLAMDIMGKAGMKAVQLLGESEGIEKLEARAKRLGIVMTQFDADRLNAAQDALDDIQFIVAALGAKLASDLAPALVTVIELLTEGETTSSDLIHSMNALADVTVFVGGVVIGAWDAVYDEFMRVKAGLYQMVKLGTQGFANLAEGANVLSEALGNGALIEQTAIDSIKQSFAETADEQARLAAIANKSNAGFDFYNKYTNSTNTFSEALKKNREALAAQRAELNKGENEAEKWIETLEKQLATVGMSTEEAKLWELQQQEVNAFLLGRAKTLINDIKLKEQAIEKEKELAKATEDVAKKAADAAEKQIEAIKAKAEAEKEARKNAADTVRESVKTDKEKRGDEIARLTQMLFAGDINEDTFNKAFKKAKGDQGPQEARFAGLALKGSAEARASILRNQSLTNNPQNKIADNTAKMLLEAKKQTENLVKVVTGVQKFQLAKW